MQSSGQTPLATTSSDAITILQAGGDYENLVICWDAAIDAFLSLDGGATWGFCPNDAASPARFKLYLTKLKLFGQSVMIKRSGNTNVTGIYAWAI